MAIDLNHINSNKRKEEIHKATGLKEILNRDISFSSGFSDKKKEKFYSDLHTLSQAGIDLRSSIDLLLEEKLKPKDFELIQGIRNNIVKGSSFSKALETTKKFSPYEYFSIQIGEETGQLPEILKELSGYFSKRIALKRQMIKVFSYPVFVILLAVGVVYFMMRYIVPMFGTIFKRFGSELPSMTKRVIGMSDFMVNYSPIFFLTNLALIVFLYTNRKKIWFRRASSQFVLKLPFFGDLIRKVYLARFCQSLNLLVSSKTNLTEALEMVEQMINFYPMEVALKAIKKDLEKGKKLSVSMSQFSVFDSKMISLIKVAEEVNMLGEIFHKLSEQYTADVDHRTETLGTVMEPLLMIIIGSIVGFILIALYLPMFNLGNTIH